MPQKEPQKSSLSEALRLFRVFHDLSVSELAKRLGVSAAYVSSIENDRKKPNLKLIEKYAEVFETTPASIMFFAEEIGARSKKTSLKSQVRTSIIKFLKAIEDGRN